MRDTFCSMKIILCACLALTFPVAAAPAPAKPAAQIASVSIDPKAHAIFARAATLYKIVPLRGNLRALLVNWKTNERVTGEPDATYNSSLEFEVSGRLRLKTPDAIYRTLIVSDGKIMWLQLRFPDPISNSTLEHQTLYAETAWISAMDEIQASNEIAVNFYHLLSGINILDSKNIEYEMIDYGLTEVRAIVLPAQPFNGKACELVRITKISPNDSTPGGGRSVQQLTYWFARSDGQLMRLQNRTTMGADASDVSDSQITKQDFNPKFAPDTFKFTPPKGAKLRAN